MNKKKTILTVTIYLVCLVAVIGIFIFYNANQTEQNKTRCYITTTNIEAGTLIDTNVLAVSFKQDEVHVSYKETLNSYGANLISDASTIVNKQTAGFIPAGSIITDKMFITMQEEIVYDGISNPQYITLPVMTDAIPAEGFEAGQRVSVIGLMSMADLSQTELVEAATETWVGILTNRAEVFSVITDETGVITNVVLVVEKDVYATLLISASTAKLYYLDGEVENISEVQSDVIKSIYQSTGLTTTQDFEITVSETVTEKKYDNFKLKIDKDEDAEITNLQILQLGSSNSVVLSWTGTPVNAFVKHYDLEGKKGCNYGSYSYASTDYLKKIYYDSNSEEHKLAIELESTPKGGEGYYEIKFYDKDNKFVGKTHFVIEGDSKEWISKSTGVKVAMNKYSKGSTDYVTAEKYIIDYSLRKEYFDKIEALSNYYEKITFTDEALKLNEKDYILDLNEKIGKLFNLDIKNIKLRETKDGYSPVDANIFYYTDFIDIDYEVTVEQCEKFRELLNSKMNNMQISERYTYSSLQTLIESLTEMKELLLNETTKTYTTLSYFVRFLITGEDMTVEEYTEIHNMLYIEENGVPTPNNVNYYKLLVEVDGYDTPFIIDLTFIAKFEIDTPNSETDAETSTDVEGGTN